MDGCAHLVCVQRCVVASGDQPVADALKRFGGLETEVTDRVVPHWVLRRRGGDGLPRRFVQPDHGAVGGGQRLPPLVPLPCCEAEPGEQLDVRGEGGAVADGGDEETGTRRVVMVGVAVEVGLALVDPDAAAEGVGDTGLTSIGLVPHLHSLDRRHVIDAGHLEAELGLPRDGPGAGPRGCVDADRASGGAHEGVAVALGGHGAHQAKGLQEGDHRGRVCTEPVALHGTGDGVGHFASSR